MQRPDEVGRLIFFQISKKKGKLDPLIEEAISHIPISGIYYRSLARYPQHHHDLHHMFHVPSVLHPPKDSKGRSKYPTPSLPGESSLDLDSGIEPVLGHHKFYGFDVHKASTTGISTGVRFLY